MWNQTNTSEKNKKNDLPYLSRYRK